MVRGNRFLEQKQYRKAVIEFKVSAQNAPRSAEPVYQLGMTYLAAKVPRMAYETFRQAVALDPKHEGAQYQLALFRVSSGDDALILKAVPVLTGYIAHHPADADALAGLSLAQARMGNKAEALRLLELAIPLSPAEMRPSSTLIGVYTVKGDMATAREIAQRTVRLLPNSPEAAVLSAQVALATQNFAQADADLKRALELRPNFVPALQLRLKRELIAGDKGRAGQTVQLIAAQPGKENWAAWARFLFTQGKPDAGSAEFEKVLKEHGNPADLRGEYSTLLLASGRPEQAEAVIDGTLKAYPKDTTALLQRTTLEVDRGDVERASGDAKALLDAGGDSPQLSFQRARIFALRGESRRQGDMLNEALRRDPSMLAARFELARLLIVGGNPKTALRVLEQASYKDQKLPVYLFFRNWALIADGDLAEARKAVDASLAAVRTPEFLYQDASLWMKNHDLMRARQSLEAAFHLAPANPDTLRVLGDVMRQQGQLPLWLSMLKDAARKNVRVATLQTSLATQMAQSGDPASARATYEAAKDAGDDAGADCGIALLDIQAGALQQATERLNNLLTRQENATARMLLADIETRNGYYDRAIAEYLKVLKNQPANVLALNNLAGLLSSRTSRYEDALFYGQKAYAISPGEPAIADTVGWIYYRLGKYDQSLDLLRNSLKRKDRPVAHYHLAAALVKTGDPKGGLREYLSAIQQDPQSPYRHDVEDLFAGK